jgi:hypothetical protein
MGSRAFAELVSQWRSSSSDSRMVGPRRICWPVIRGVSDDDLWAVFGFAAEIVRQMRDWGPKATT